MMKAIDIKYIFLLTETTFQRLSFLPVVPLASLALPMITLAPLAPPTVPYASLAANHSVRGSMIANGTNGTIGGTPNVAIINLSGKYL